jgi:hypothetical protein
MHGEGALLVERAGDGQSVLGAEAVELPLGHALVLLLAVPRVVQRHLEVGVLPLPAVRRPSCHHNVVSSLGARCVLLLSS